MLVLVVGQVANIAWLLCDLVIVMLCLFQPLCKQFELLCIEN